MRKNVLLLLVLSLAACDDDPIPSSDAGPRLDAGRDAAMPPSDAGPPMPDAGPAGYRVFVSSATLSGNAVADASATCRRLAHAAGLGGGWWAWTSTVSQPSSRVDFGDGPWIRLDGAVAFESLEEFASGPRVPLDRDERGETVSGEVFTGATSRGDATGRDCRGWSSHYDTEQVTVGDIGATDGTWSDARVVDCAAPRHVVCFEDGSYPDTTGLPLVTAWNEQMLSAVRRGPARPTVVSRALFIVSAAMYDAWAAYDSTASGYAYDDAAEGDAAAQEAAVSYAAYWALAAMFEDYEASTRFFVRRLNALGHTLPTGAETGPAAVGHAAANAVLAARTNDGSNHMLDFRDAVSDRYPTAYEASNDADPSSSHAAGGADFDPNRWTPIRVPTGLVRDDSGRPTVDHEDARTYADQVFLTPHWGAVVPFALAASDAFRPPAPPRLGMTQSYTDALGATMTENEAYRQQFGALVDVSADLTDEQKVLAEFWADGPRSETPPGHWNQIAHGVSIRDAHTVAEDVQMYLALNGALFDAGIATWECKRHYDYVRPVTVIHHLYAGQNIEAWAGPGLGTRTIAAEAWRPYQDPTFVTPPFAEYVSGHSTFSRAAAEVLTRFTGSPTFYDGVSRSGQDIDRDGVEDLLGEHRQRAHTNLFEDSPAEDVTLRWPTFQDAADEAGVSRIYGGIHIQDGDLRGRELGRQVGIAAFERASALFGE